MFLSIDIFPEKAALAANVTVPSGVMLNVVDGIVPE
jgi:hypothetical protein